MGFIKVGVVLFASLLVGMANASNTGHRTKRIKRYIE